MKYETMDLNDETLQHLRDEIHDAEHYHGRLMAIVDDDAGIIGYALGVTSADQIAGALNEATCSDK
jgi:hypothetical protein